MVAAIRGALERAGNPDAGARVRIYQSARNALLKSLEHQGVTDRGLIAQQQARLEALIEGIEAEWLQQPAPGAGGTSAQAGRPPTEPPIAGGRREPGFAGPPKEVREPVAGTSASQLDIAPSVDGRQPRQDQPTRRQKRGTTEAPAKTRARPAKRRLPFYSAILSGAIMLSFIGMGAWWLIDSGALKSAAERDTRVPNPPHSLSEADYPGNGPVALQQHTPGGGFSDDWVEIYRPGKSAEVTSSRSAQTELMETDQGQILRITSRAPDQSGEVKIPLTPETVQALTGRTSVLALSLRSATSETTQIYIECDFGSLGGCGRRRFDVTYAISDVLLNLDLGLASGTVPPGQLIINSDISGQGHGIDLLAVRMRPDR